MASPMLQEVFGGQLLGLDVDAIAHPGAEGGDRRRGGGAGRPDQPVQQPRPDLLGVALGQARPQEHLLRVLRPRHRRSTALLPTLGHLGLAGLFVAAVCVILTMYGGGFATVPAYLADIFGTQMVGAIHGRLITAWSVAGVIGPAADRGLTPVRSSTTACRTIWSTTARSTSWPACCSVGLVCNLLIRPVNEKHLMTDDELARERALQREDRIAGDAETAARGGAGVGVVLAWLAVGIPFFIGLFIALQKAAALM